MFFPHNVEHSARRRQAKDSDSGSGSGSGSGSESEEGEESSEDEHSEGDLSEGSGRSAKQVKARGGGGAAAALESVQRIIAERKVDGKEEFRVKLKGALLTATFPKIFQDWGIHPSHQGQGHRMIQ